MQSGVGWTILREPSMRPHYESLASSNAGSGGPLVLVGASDCSVDVCNSLMTWLASNSASASRNGSNSGCGFVGIGAWLLIGRRVAPKGHRQLTLEWALARRWKSLPRCRYRCRRLGLRSISQAHSAPVFAIPPDASVLATNQAPDKPIHIRDRLSQPRFLAIYLSE